MKDKKALAEKECNQLRGRIEKIEADLKTELQVLESKKVVA
jgi:hypothetical protein